EMCNSSHDSMHRSCKVDFVLIVHGHTNEEFGFARGAANILSQVVPIQNEVVWIASHGGISHVRELPLIPPRQKAVQYGWNLAFQNELAVNEPDLFLCHLCLACSSAILRPFWCRSIMIDLARRVRVTFIGKGGIGKV